MNIRNGLRLAVDIGGTFTDTVLMDATCAVVATAKTPTTPDQPAIAAVEGARRVLKAAKVGWAEITGLCMAQH